MQYIVKYRLFFHTLYKEIEDTIKTDNGLSYFIGKRTFSVYNEYDAIDFIKASHKLGEIDKLCKVSLEIYNSEYSKVSATSLKILKCWIG